MGHRIISQNRGRGGPRYRAPSHRYKAELKHLGQAGKTISYKIVDIEHDPARHTPIALVDVPGGEKTYVLVTEGMGIGDMLTWGSEAEIKNGNTLPLQDIPTGSAVCNIEACPNDGGKFVRASGVQATVTDSLMAVLRSGCQAEQQMV